MDPLMFAAAPAKYRDDSRRPHGLDTGKGVLTLAFDEQRICHRVVQQTWMVDLRNLSKSETGRIRRHAGLVLKKRTSNAHRQMSVRCLSRGRSTSGNVCLDPTREVKPDIAARQFRAKNDVTAQQRS